MRASPDDDDRLYKEPGLLRRFGAPVLGFLLLALIVISGFQWLTGSPQVATLLPSPVPVASATARVDTAVPPVPAAPLRSGAAAGGFSALPPPR